MIPQDSELLQVRVMTGEELSISMWEYPDAVPVRFTVSEACKKGVCGCVYMLQGSVCQLKPCRFFIESYLRGQVDTDADYILRGIAFGFKVVDDSFDGKLLTMWERDLIGEKLKAGLAAGMISEVEEEPTCIHAMFVVPKDGGGGRVVVDCSKPKSSSVNNATSSVASKFKYLGVNHVVDLIEKGDYLSSTDIKDAYKAVQIYPGHRGRQGLCWRFAAGEDYKYMVDNRLCMVLLIIWMTFVSLGETKGRMVIGNRG